MSIPQINVEEERWLPVVGYEGSYEVSDHGNVRSVDRCVMRSNGVPQTIRARILKGIVADPEAGYVEVTLYHNGTGIKRHIHRLVLETFVGPCPPGMEALHANDMPADNRKTNLRWGTKTENGADAVRNGRCHKANQTTCIRGHELRIYIWRGRRMRRCDTCARDHYPSRRRKTAC